MRNKDIKEEKLLDSIGQEWKEANRIKQELKLDITTTRLGKLLAEIARQHPEISMKKQGNRFYYRLKHTPLNKTIPKNNMKERLVSLVDELRALGMDLTEIQEIAYQALDKVKGQLQTEIRYITLNAPTFKQRYDKLRSNFIQLEGKMKEAKSA